MSIRQNVLIITGILFLSNLLLPLTRVIPMPGLVNLDELQVFGSRMYIGEFPYVYIYSSEDFQLLKKIGKKGEGPREFMQYCLPIVVKDKLIVSSQQKVTFFTLDGEYISEKKIRISGASFKLAGDFYGVYAYTSQNKIDYRAIDVYDAYFKKVKELYRYRLWFQRQGPIKGAYVVDSSRFRFNVLEQNLVWTDMKDFIVYIWNSKTGKLITIKQKYEAVKISDKDIKNYHQNLNRPKNRKYYLQIKPFIKFPTYFPPIKGFAVADDKVYVYTYQKKGELTEFYIFNISGKLVKKNLYKSTG